MGTLEAVTTNRDFMGLLVRDTRSGLVGKVIGTITWDGLAERTLVVQPQVLSDSTVPGTHYVPSSVAEVVERPNERGVN